MTLVKLKTRTEYRECGDYDRKVRVKHYIVELDDVEYKRLLEFTDGQNN